MKQKKLKAPESLKNREQKMLSQLFLFWWAVVVLAPGQQRQVRGLLAKLGFVERKGKLALTPMGRRTLAFAQAPAKKAVRR